MDCSVIFRFCRTRSILVLVNASAEWHLMCLLRAYTTWCAVLFLILLFKKFLSKQTALGRYFADSSYFIYLLHFPIQLSFSSYLRDRSRVCVTLFFNLFDRFSGLFALLLYHLTCRGTVIGALLSGRRNSLNLTNEFNELKRLMRKESRMWKPSGHRDSVCDR